MSVNRWKMVAMPVVVLGLASPVLANCGPGGLGGKGTGLGDIASGVTEAAEGCDEFGKGEISKLDFSAKGGAKLNGQIKAFLDASAKLKAAAVKVDADLAASCAKLGKDLGMKDDEVKIDEKAEGGKKAEPVCTAVSAKVKAAIDASAKGKLSVKIEPPQCYADIDALMKCYEECGSPVKGGKLDVACKEGKLSGKCDAQCTGSCTVDADVKCTGVCKGSCSGKCDASFSGTCGGKCDGKCDGKASKGECKGVCEGKCDAKAEGSCGGTCDGECSASCEIKGAAKCEGQCTGGCSVDYKAPSCTGKFEPPEVDISCQTSCTAKSIADIKCDPPELKIAFTGQASVDGVKVVGALQKTLPKIAKIQLGNAAKLAVSVKAVGDAGADLGKGAVDAGVKAALCIKEAVAATVSASASISVNVNVSAKVSGSASGSAG